METATFWWKNFDSFHQLFDTLRWNYFCLSVKNSLETLSKMHSLCIFRKKKLKHAFLWKTLIFFTSFGLPLEIFRPNQFFFWRSLSKLPSTWPYEIFEEQFSPAKSCSQSFSELSGSFSEFDWSFPGGFFKTEIYESRRTFWRKFCFLKKMHFLSISDIERKILALCFEFLSAQLSKLHSKCPKEQLKGIEFFPAKNYFFINLGDWDKLFNLVSKLLRQVYQNCALRVPANSLRE